MRTLSIKNISDETHEKLKRRARKNHRSMNQEIVTILEDALKTARLSEPPEPYRGKFPIDEEWLDLAKREGRE